MKYVVVLLWGIFLWAGFCRAQVVMDASERKQQVDFIKHDTLPVEIKELPSVINSSYSEYNGMLFPDSTFYFSSLRPESEDDFANIFSQFWSTRIYKSKLTIGGYSKPEPLGTAINDDKYYNCNFTFDSSRTRLLFSRCLRDSGKELQCSLWSSERKGGHWQKAQPLNRRINLPGTTTTQPCWVDYGDYSVMYFVSNRPKGFGDMDIWYTIFRNGHFDDPINAGSAINTLDNEVTPFYDKNTGRLYFSSDGTHLTIGGYDIFVANGSLSQWSEPENVGVPINSEANDIYFIVNQHNKDGFFASNRPKNPDADADTCCTDLYAFHYLYEEDTVPEEDTIVADTISVTEKAVLLLPITLYFHNDEPDPKTTATTTKQNYRNTLANYLALNDLYQNEYAKGLKGAAADEARRKIARFFADSVENGFRKLEEFTALLLRDLKAGKNVEITICGFASPLHKADYNLALSSRRIASFVNYLQDYDNGIFLPYLSGSAKNRLTVIREPEGSSLAKREVSDNPNDQRNSVYSIAASKERKIQITKYIAE